MNRPTRTASAVAAATVLLGTLATATPAEAATPSVCGAGKWTVAARQAVKPGEIVLYKQKASKNTMRVCGVYFNYSGKRQVMRVRMIAQPRPKGGMLTRKMGDETGRFRVYAGPLVGTVSKGVKVRVFGYPSTHRGWNVVDVVV